MVAVATALVALRARLAGLGVPALGAALAIRLVTDVLAAALIVAAVFVTAFLALVVVLPAFLAVLKASPKDILELSPDLFSDDPGLYFALLSFLFFLERFLTF